MTLCPALRTSAFIDPIGITSPSSAGASRCYPWQERSCSTLLPSSCDSMGRLPRVTLGERSLWYSWRGLPHPRGFRYVLFLEPDSEDVMQTLSFELGKLLEITGPNPVVLSVPEHGKAYIERESEAGNRNDYERVRDLVPHMKKRWWKASDKAQTDMAEDLGMDDFQFATKEYVPGIKAQPWWNPSEFDWARGLEDASPIIQEEYRAVRDSPDSQALFKTSKEGGYTSQGWTHIPLVSMREPKDRYESQRSYFPNTLKVLEDLGILANARAVLIGRQEPMSGIKMHSDGTNAVITAHLGLDVPGEEQCLMWVGVNMERYPWCNNKLLCMDTSYLHWTRNNTEEERIILLIMVWHPELTPKEQRVFEYLDSLIRHAVSGLPLPTEPFLPIEGGV